MSTFFYLLAIIALGATISLFEVPALLQRKMRGELLAFGGFLITGMALAMALTLKLPVPNPTAIIEFVLSPLVRLLYAE